MALYSAFFCKNLKWSQLASGSLVIVSICLWVVDLWPFVSEMQMLQGGAGYNSHSVKEWWVSFVKYKSSYRHYKLVTVKIKLGRINSFRPVHVSSLACSLFPCFLCLSEKSHFYFCCNTFGHFPFSMINIRLYI